MVGQPANLVQLRWRTTCPFRYPESSARKFKARNVIKSALRIHRAFLIVVVMVSWSMPSGGTVRAQPLQQEALESPTLTAAASGATAIDASWMPVTGAVRYELWVWLDDETGWQQLDEGDLSGTSFTHAGLTAGRTY